MRRIRDGLRLDAGRGRAPLTWGRWAWLAGASVAALSAAPAFAQTTTTAPVTTQPATRPDNNPAGDNRAAEASSVMTEVVVTATRQAQTINRVPVSVSAFTQEQMDLQGIRSFGDVARYTPGVNFDPESHNISIRGVSSTAGAATTGIYIDDTPIQIRGLGLVSNQALPEIFDLDRVEVLRGPQGTLFGAGSEGGTVRYITPQPSLTKFSMYGRAEGSLTGDGGDPNGELGLAVGGPILDNRLGFRVSGWYRRDGGYVDRTDQASGAVTKPNANGTDTLLLRGALAWAPVGGLTITPSIFYQKRNQHDTDEFWNGISNLGHGVFQNGDPEALGDADKYLLPALRAEYDTHGVSLISNTSYFYRHEETGYEGTLYNLSYFQQLISDPTGVNCGACTTGNLYPLLTPNGFNLPGFGAYSAPNTITNKQNNFTQEIRLQSANPNGRINFVFGAFYQYNRQLSVEQIHDPQLEQITTYLFGESAEDYWGEGLLPQYGDDDYINHTLGHDDQLAGFADVTLAITPKLKIEGGVRYARTHFDFTNFGDGAQNFGRTEGSGGETEHPVTPKGSIQYQADANNLYYFTYAKGYRVGGANPPIPYNACITDFQAIGLTSSPDTYQSDTVNSYEIGSKNRLFNRRLQIEASAYYLKWSGIQQENYLPTCGFQYIANLGEAESKGFDIQFELEVIHNLTAELTIGYTDAKYIKTLQEGPGTLVNDGDTLATPQDTAAPPLTLSFGAQYNYRIGLLPAFSRIDYEYASHSPWQTPQEDAVTTSYDGALVNPPATNFISLRSGVDLKGVNVSLFVDNLLDSRPQLSLSHQDQFTVLFEQTTFRPRTVGLTATYRY